MKIVCSTGCCHCPKCWNLDPTAVCISKGGKGGTVFTVREANDDGIERTFGPGFLAKAEARTFIDQGGPWA